MFGVFGVLGVFGLLAVRGLTGLAGETVWVFVGSLVGSALAAGSSGPRVAAAARTTTPSPASGADDTPRSDKDDTPKAATGLSASAAAPPMTVHLVLFMLLSPALAGETTR